MQDFLEDFRTTIDVAAKQLLKISPEKSQIPRAQGKWSPKEIIGHLIDSASNNHQNYQRESWPDLVQLWRLYNQHILHLISLVPEETRTKLRYQHNLHQIASDTLSETEPVTLEWFMRDYVDHLKKHLKQILG